MDLLNPPPPSLEFKRAIRSSNGSWYRIVEWVGRGGSNVVYLCVSSEGPQANSLVAVKFSLAYRHEKRHKRFLHEIRFLKEHQHPNILKVTDWGTWEENTLNGVVRYPFFVTEYLPKTMQDVIRERSANASEKAAYIMQVLSALAY